MFCVKGIGCPCCTLSTFYPVLKNIGIETYRDLEQVTKLFFKHFCARNHNRSTGHQNISLRLTKSKSLLYENSHWIIEQKFALAEKTWHFVSHKNAGLQKQKNQPQSPGRKYWTALVYQLHGANSMFFFPHVSWCLAVQLGNHSPVQSNHFNHWSVHTPHHTVPLSNHCGGGLLPGDG